MDLTYGGYGGGRTSAVRSMMSRLGGGARPHVSRTESALLTLRQIGEEGVVAGALGAVHASRDSGLDAKSIPIDGVLAVIGFAGAVALDGDPIATDVRNIGSAGLAVFAFRKTADLIAKKRGTQGVSKGVRPGATKVHGDFGADPIMGADMGADPIVAASANL